METPPSPATPGFEAPALDCQAALPWSELRDELARFSLESLDGQLELVTQLADASHAALGSPARYDGEALARFRRELLPRYRAERLASARRSGVTLDAPLLPLRSRSERLETGIRRGQHLLGLGLRSVEWRASLPAALRRSFLEAMLKVRATDDELKAMYYPGVETPIAGRRFGGKGFRSRWQEAIVAVGFALEQGRAPDGRYSGDVAAPMIRDLGVGLAMGYGAREVLAAQLGKAASPMNGGLAGQGGRDLHWGDLDRGLLVATAPLAIATSTLTGLALAMQRRDEARICVSFIGEGGSSQGDWYEALNLAGARRLPMLFIIENNRVALGTEVAHQSGVELFAEKAAAAGMPALCVDGACPDRLYAAVRAAREHILSPDGGPVLLSIEAMRGCGHAHHDDERYRKVEGERVSGYADHAAWEFWEQHEPLVSYPARLEALGLLEAGQLESLRAAANAQARDARAEVEAGPWADTERLGQGVSPGEDAERHDERRARRERDWRWDARPQAPSEAQPLDGHGWTLRVAIEEALCAAAERYGDGLVMLGEDLEYGGAFGITQRLRSRGYSSALLDTPLAESAIVGAAVGLGLDGLRAMAEIQFNAFAAHAFSQIVNNAASIHWRYGRELPIVIRIPVGAGLAGGPYHALSNETWFSATPGLKILYPATPSDAYHGLLEAFADPGPVLFLEHLTLYPPAGRNTAFGFPVRQTVDVEATRPILGRAARARAGDALTIVTWGAMLHFALRAAETLAAEGIQAEVLDLRSLWPLDVDSCLHSLQRTGRLLVLQEASHRSGYGHYVVSRILERGFMELEAPPLVLGAMDTLPPFAPHLEQAWMPSIAEVAEAARALVIEAGRNRGQ